MEIIVTNLYAKFDNDRLWNEKALVDRKSEKQQLQEEKQQEQRSWPLGTRFQVQKCHEVQSA